MADRTGAGLFAAIFCMLASEGDIDRRAMAHAFWRLSQEYDFAPYQLYCDDELEKLGLARRGVDPRHPDEGETIVYGPEEGG